MSELSWQQAAERGSGRRWFSWLLLVLVLTALGLRLHQLDAESLFLDELNQVSNYSDPISHLLYGAASQQQPPLDYLMGFLFAQISPGDFAVRLPAALFGTGSVLFLVLLAVRLASWPVALGCGLLAALLPFNVYFSQEARPYSIAVFFLLVMLWSLVRLLENRVTLKVGSAIFGGMAGCFLYSRSLAPLATVMVLALLLVGLAIKGRLRANNPAAAEFNRRLHYALAALIMALCCFLPIFLLIYEMGQSYLVAMPPGPTALVARLARLSLEPLWRAVLVQGEPLGPVLLVMALAAPLLARGAAGLQETPLWPLVVLLLPGAALLDLSVFQLTSNFPFRPPYAISLLPLLLLLAAASFQRLWDLGARSRYPRAGRLIMVGLGVVLVAMAAQALGASKEFRKKSDWRGVSAYLAAHYDNNSVLIFDSLARQGDWEPTFYGFPRYYHGNSPRLAMAAVPGSLAHYAEGRKRPVLLLFQGQEYRLTPASPYPFFPLVNPGITHSVIAAINADPAFVVREFTGFSVITLRESTDDFAGDIQRLTEKILTHIPADDSSRVELEQAGAAARRQQAERSDGAKGRP